MLKDKQQRTPVVVAFTIALAAILVWPTWIASRNGLSDLHARPAIDYLENMQFDALSVNKEQWQAIEDRVAYADKLMPSNPQYLEALGRLSRLKLTFLADGSSFNDKGTGATTSEDYFRRSVENRPTWPYYWGNLALEHYRRGNVAADEYSLALANTSRFGPWKNDAQQVVMDLGGETWEFLSPDARHEYVLNVERGLHRQPQNTVRIVRNYSAWPKICRASANLPVVEVPHLRTICGYDDISQERDSS